MNACKRNGVARTLLYVTTCLSVGILCFVGLVETTAEMSGQNRWFAYSVSILSGCATITWIFNSRKTKTNVVDLAAAAMFAWYLVAYSVDDSIVLSELLEIALLAAAYVSLRVLFSSYRSLSKWLLFVLCVCGIFEAATGIRQAFGVGHSNHSLFGVTGTFFNPGPYGGYLAVILSMTLGYLASEYQYAQKIFCSFKRSYDIRLRHILWSLLFCTAAGTVMATMIIIPSTMSRAAFVAAGIAVIMIVMSNRSVNTPVVNYIRRHKTGTRIIGLVSVLVLFTGLYGIYVLKKDSADGRLLMWKTGAKVMMENPATGVGPGYYRGAYGDVQSTFFRDDDRSETEIKVAGSPEYGFNEFILVGAETGIPGLLLMLLLTGAALRRLLSARTPYAYGFAALLVFACFSYPFSLIPMQVLFVIFLAFAGTVRLERRKATIAHRIVAGVAVAGCAGMVILVTKPYIDKIEATKDWQEARRWYSMEMYSYVLEDYPGLFPLMKENSAFLFEYGRSLQMEGRYSESLEMLVRATRLSSDPMNYNVIGNNYKTLGEYDKAAEAYLKAYYIVPNRMYPLYLLGKMYSEIGDTENARRYARMVVDMVPKIVSPATDDMQCEMREVLMK